MIWPSSLHPSSSFLLSLAFSAALPVGTESCILTKGATNESQRSEMKLVMNLVWNPGFLTPVHGSFCGTILLATFIEIF